MLNTLYRKLTVLLVAFTGVVTLMFTVVMNVSHEKYHRELVQKLNASLARQLVVEGRLDALPTSSDGPGDTASRLRELTRVNPSVDLYLLDGAGRVVAASVPQERIARPQVSLEPIERLLNGSREFPLRGDDPTANGRGAVFSAARVSGSGASYLYAVLHSSDHASDAGHRAVAEDLRQSYALREAAMLTGAGVLFSLLAGLAVIAVITRPLRRLSEAMERFQASNFTAPSIPAIPDRADDEVAHIGKTFDRMAARIRSQMEDLRSADAELRDMFACISHDLRTPLASVQGYLETLLLKYDCLPDAERKRYAEVAVQQAGRLGALVNALFDLAKLESRHTRLNLERFSVTDLAQDVVQKFEPSASRKGIALLVNMPRRLPLVTADLTLVERVLDNLIENALRYTPRDGRIAISAVAEDGHLRVSVEDTGSGIAPDDLPHIFERFYRGRNGSSHRHEGAGLGLAFVKRVIELHGGTVSVASSPGAATRFAFQLPISIAAGPPTHGEKASNASPANS